MAKVLRIDIDGETMFDGTVLALTWSEDENTVTVTGRMTKAPARPPNSPGGGLASLLRPRTPPKAEDYEDAPAAE
mgnify:FL=1